MHWLAHILGIDNETGRWYAFWSGFGSDIGEVTIIGGLVAIYRKHTCEVHRCWRLGRHTTQAGHAVCRKHHPDGPLTADDVLRAHKAAEARRNPFAPALERLRRGEEKNG